MRSETIRFAAILFLISVAGAAVRVFGLEKNDLWLDEACSYYWAHHFPHWPLAREDVWREPTFAYLLSLTAWMRAFGETEFVLRSLSAAAGSMAVAAVGMAGRRYFGTSVGIVAGLLAAFHPLHIHYCQEARAYAPWTLLITLLLMSMMEAVKTQRWRWWFVYGLLLLTSLLTHLYTLYLVPATLAILLTAPNRRRCLRTWVVVHILVFGAFLPFAGQFIFPRLSEGPGAWTRKIWMDHSPLLVPLRSLWALLPSGSYPSYLGALHFSAESATASFGGLTGLTIRWLPALLIGSGLVVLLTVRRALGLSTGTQYDGVKMEEFGSMPQIVQLGVLGTLVLVPLISAWLQAVVLGQGYLVARYDMVVWPAMILFCAAIVSQVATCCRSRTTRHLMRVMVMVGLLGSSVLTLLGRSSVAANRDVSDRAAAILKHVDNDDLVISVGLYRWFMNYQWEQLGFSPDIVSFPFCHDQQVCWDDPTQELVQLDTITKELAVLLDRIKFDISSGRSVWILANGSGEGPRWEIDRLLFAAIEQAGVEIEPIDEWLGLIRLRAANASSR